MLWVGDCMHQAEDTSLVKFHKNWVDMTWDCTISNGMVPEGFGKAMGDLFSNLTLYNTVFGDIVQRMIQIYGKNY